MIMKGCWASFDFKGCAMYVILLSFVSNGWLVSFMLISRLLGDENIVETLLLDVDINHYYIIIDYILLIIS